MTYDMRYKVLLVFLLFFFFKHLCIRLQASLESVWYALGRFSIEQTDENDEDLLPGMSYDMRYGMIIIIVAAILLT